MKRVAPLVASLAAASVWAWACSDDAPAGGGTPDAGNLIEAGALDPSTRTDGATPGPDSAAVDECAAVDASVPTGQFGHPNEGDAGYATVPFPTENPYSYEKEILGKILFWDEQMSSDDTVACGTCHHPAAGGSDPRAATARHPGADGLPNTADDVHGASGVARCDDSSGAVVRKADAVFGMNVQVTRRKAPTYLDAMFARALFWDGRANDAFVDPESPSTTVIPQNGALESQSVGPPMNATEMACENRTWAKLTAKLGSAKPLAKAKNVPPEMAAAVCKYKTYPALFNAAFGASDITAVKIAKAIATHERTLISNQTPYDKDAAGDANALSDAQKRGRDLFKGKALCLRCHAAPLFGTTNPPGLPTSFSNLGFETDAGIAWDRGRAEVTDAGADVGVFKSATLRNVGLREAGGLLHGGIGAGADLPTLIAKYNDPPQLNYNASALMSLKLGLTEQEQADLIDFLRNGLTDPRVKNEQYPFDRPKLGTE